jgi:hypothetical protein
MEGGARDGLPCRRIKKGVIYANEDECRIGLMRAFVRHCLDDFGPGTN